MRSGVSWAWTRSFGAKRAHCGVITNMSDLIRVLVCGTGNGAHALAGILSTRPNVEVVVLSQNTDKVHRWSNLMHRSPFTVTARQKGCERVEYMAKPFTVTDQPDQPAPAR